MSDYNLLLRVGTNKSRVQKCGLYLAAGDLTAQSWGITDSSEES